MPSSVALILFAALIFYLLKLDRKEGKIVSLGSWIPTLWVLYCASRPLACWRSNYLLLAGDGSSAKEGSIVDRNFLTVLIVLGVATLARRRFDWRAVLRANAWLTTLYLFVAVSVFWSVVPFVSFKQVIRLVGGAIMGLVILSEKSPAETLESILRRVAYVLIPLSLMLIKYFPNLGVFYLQHTGARWWIGVTTTKNNLGVLCLISAYFLVWRLVKQWPGRKASETKRGMYVDLLVLGMTLFVMNGEVAYSATSLACLAIGIATMSALYWMQNRRLKLGAMAGLAPVLLIFLFGAAMPFVGTAAASGLTSLLGRDATFTGRTDIWAELTPMALEEPILGHGFGGFWVGNFYAEVNEAHNGYLEVCLVLGFVGLLLLLGMIISYGRDCLIVAYKNPWGRFGCGLLVMIVFHNVTEASFLRESDAMWTSFVFLKLLNSQLARSKLPAMQLIDAEVQAAASANLGKGAPAPFDTART
jgi:exopolysaccharide production protein ExoQ